SRDQGGRLRVISDRSGPSERFVSRFKLGGSSLPIYVRSFAYSPGGGPLVSAPPDEDLNDLSLSWACSPSFFRSISFALSPSCLRPCWACSPSSSTSTTRPTSPLISALSC